MNTPTETVEQSQDPAGDTPLTGTLIPAEQRERLFKTTAALHNYCQAFGIKAGRYGMGNVDGETVVVLLYQPVND